MSNRRMVSSDTFRDEFFSKQDWFGRLLWMGMIIVCADDQGRFVNNPRLIGVDVFPLDDVVTTEQVAAKIKEFADAGRILLYDVGDKHLIQIVNWWKHQSPSWAAASLWPAPTGWVDRVKVHVKNNKVTILNWDQPGGFSELPTPVHSSLPTPVRTDVCSELSKPIDEYESERSMRGVREEYESGGGAAVQREAAPEIPVPIPSPVLSGEKAWDFLRSDLRGSVDLGTYRSKVEPCEVIGWKDGALQIRAPDERARTWLTNIFGTFALQSKITAVMGEGSRISFEA